MKKKKTKKKKKKVSKRLTKMQKEIKKELELMHRMRSTAFSYHAYKPKRNGKLIAAKPDKRKKDWFFSVASARA